MADPNFTDCDSRFPSGWVKHDLAGFRTHANLFSIGLSFAVVVVFRYLDTHLPRMGFCRSGFGIHVSGPGDLSLLSFTDMNSTQHAVHEMV